MTVTSIIQRSAITLTLFTATGILVHDTKLDYAATTALALPAILMTLDLEKSFKSGDHTHVERVSFSQAMSTVGRGTPRIQPRDDHKRFLLPQKTVKGHHPFDGYYLPADS